MSYLAHQKDFGRHVCASPSVPAAPVDNGATAGWRHTLRRFFGGIFESHDKQLERELGQFIARSGGNLTDSLEREMMHRITRSGIGTWR